MTNEKQKTNKRSLFSRLIEGLFDQNPILVQLLGTCPTLATSTSAKNGIGMGLSATAVLILSNLLISLLRKFIPKQVRIAAYIVIISGFVTAIELLIKAFLPSLDASLGLFIPLIVVNCIILARAVTEITTHRMVFCFFVIFVHLSFFRCAFLRLSLQPTGIGVFLQSA